MHFGTFIPINFNNKHWALITVNVQERRIKYYDSSYKLNYARKYDYAMQLIIHFLTATEELWSSGVPEGAEWERDIKWDISQQAPQSGDCGIYVCFYAHYLARNAAMNLVPQFLPC